MKRKSPSVRSQMTGPTRRPKSVKQVRPQTSQRAKHRISSMALFLCSLLLGAVPAHAQTYTLAPYPYYTGLDNSGLIVAGGCLWTYAAGTTTPAATYRDTIGTANANPVILDSAGRATVYLVVGQTYKFVLETACTPPAHGSVLRTQDQIAAVPPSGSVVTVTGTAGVNLTAGEAVYLSDGSGSLTAGLWYAADTSNAYSSTRAVVGLTQAAIASGSAGAIQLAGPLTLTTSLTVGVPYYVGASGAITSTAPANNQRPVGTAASTSVLILIANPGTPPLNVATCNGRLTLTTGVPVTTTDVTAATTLYFAPYLGNRCALYDGTGWTMRTFSQLSIAIPATTSQMYDVWLIDSSGTLGLELLAWTNDTTRATALTTQDGVYVKNGDATRRYLGSIRTTTSSGQTEDSLLKRFVWNEYNRIERPLRRLESTSTWTYSTATFRQANASTANQVAVIVGVAENMIDLQIRALASNSSGISTTVSVAIGEDSTSSVTTGNILQVYGSGLNTAPVGASAQLIKQPAIGYHFYAWLEYSDANATTTWYGAPASYIQLGEVGRFAN